VTFAQRHLDAGGLTVEKDCEFRCPHCRARCTESPIDGTEFGHRDGCPRRPENLPSGGGGATYEDVVDDDQEELVTDGGRDLYLPPSHFDNASKYLDDALDHVEDPEGRYAIRQALAYLAPLGGDGE
jgi:hypothetical protein